MAVVSVAGPRNDADASLIGMEGESLEGSRMRCCRGKGVMNYRLRTTNDDHPHDHIALEFLTSLASDLSLFSGLLTHIPHRYSYNRCVWLHRYSSFRILSDYKL